MGHAITWASNYYTDGYESAGEQELLSVLLTYQCWYKRAEQLGDKPLSESMMVQYYWCMYASPGLSELNKEQYSIVDLTLC